MIKILDLTRACISSLTIDQTETIKEKENVEKNIEKILKKNRKKVSQRVKKILFGTAEIKNLKYFLSKFEYYLIQNEEINLSSPEINSLGILTLFILNKYLVKEDSLLLSIMCNEEIKSKSDLNKMIYEYIFLY